jgi:signal transduction histidine kinase
MLSVNMLNWIKFHHESVKMRPENFNLRELITESVEIASTLAKEKGIAFYNDVPEHIELFQYRQAIGVIIYNLAMNATKYTLAGEIRITCQHTDNSFSLSVIDTGVGMAPELISKLNSPEPFIAGYSLSETSKYQFGYVIVKDLLRLVHGNMRVESEADKGTQATIDFDAESLSDEPRVS